MTKKSDRSGGLREIRGHRYMRIRVGARKRETIPLSGCRSEADALERCAIIADVANELISVGRRDRVRDMGVQLGAATGKREIALIRKAVRLIIDQRASSYSSGELTVRQFAEQWTNGTLHRQFPDYVKDKQKSSHVDEGHLRRSILPIVGDTPLSAFTIEDAESVMAHLNDGRDTPLASATRRHVAQVMVRLFRMAVFPCRHIKVSPIPEGFLPKVKTTKALTYLYPTEDAALLRCIKIPLFYRVLYGLMAREGLRKEEALCLEWKDVDLVHGTIRLDENKTSEPRTWAMDPGVADVLASWQGSRSEGLVFQRSSSLPTDHLARRFREHLQIAGVKRPELFERSPARQPIRIHDLRGTFVTLSLAAGRTESWVQDRTGHKSSLMIAKYRRVARTLTEVGQTSLAPLSQAIPELRGATRGAIGTQKQASNAITSSGESSMISMNCDPPEGRTRTSLRTEDFKSSREDLAERSQRENIGERDGSRRGARPLPHPLPHLAKAADHLAAERVTWDLFDLFGSEAAS